MGTGTRAFTPEKHSACSGRWIFCPNPRLTHAELNHLVGRRPLVHPPGTGPVGLPPRGPEAARALEALLMTSDSLLTKAREQMASGIPADGGPINAEIDETMRESFFLSHWLDRMQHPEQPRYDA